MSGFRRLEQKHVVAAQAKIKKDEGYSRAVLANRIFEVFDIVGADTRDKNYVKNIVNLMMARKQTPEDLLELYEAEFPNTREVNLMKFYYFYKDNPFSEDDLFVYRTFRDYVAQFTSEPVSLRAFCVSGEAILDKLDEWATDRSGNSQTAILLFYFELALVESLKLNKTFLTKPRALFEAFGWENFEKQVKQRYGDKWGWLTIDNTKMLEVKGVSDKLLKYERIRKQMLSLGDLQLYDAMALYRSEYGIDKAFAYYDIK